MGKLVLKNCKVVFSNLVDEGFGTSITIEVDENNEKQIRDFWKSENIGNEKTVIGEPNVKEYEGTKQLALKTNDRTKVAKIKEGDELGWGATIDVVINSFAYNNKFTKGKEYVGANLSAVVVTAGRRTGADADLAELLASYADADAAGADAAGAGAEQQSDAPTKGPDDLPF